MKDGIGSGKGVADFSDRPENVSGADGRAGYIKDPSGHELRKSMGDLYDSVQRSRTGGGFSTTVPEIETKKDELSVLDSFDPSELSPRGASFLLERTNRALEPQEVLSQFKEIAGKYGLDLEFDAHGQYEIRTEEELDELAGHWVDEYGEEWLRRNVPEENRDIYKEGELEEVGKERIRKYSLNTSETPDFFSVVPKQTEPQTAAGKLEQKAADFIDEHQGGVATGTALLYLAGGAVAATTIGFSLMDQDGDGLSNYEEWFGNSDWNNPDTDGDGVDDGTEVRKGLYPADSDTDRDGLSDGEELDLGTDPNDRDTDGDGLRDDKEVNECGSDPLLKDTSGDGLQDKKAVNLGLDPTVKHPSLAYAVEKGLSKDTINNLKELDNRDLNSGFGSLVDELGRLGKNKQKSFSELVAKSEDITSRENHQIHYLLDLPEEKHAELVENDLLYDFNLDDDYALNWFESNVSNTDPQDPNRRYAISVTMISDRTIPQDMILSDLKFSGHPGGRRWKLGGGTTHQKLADVIDEVDSVDDKNDLVYISLLGHGSTSEFKLSDGWISYPELDSLLDPLESKVLLVNESCYSGASIPHLSDPDRVVITSVSSDQLTNLQFRTGYSIARPGISVKEAFLSGGNRSIDSEDGPQISNPSLADEIYLYQRDAWDWRPAYEFG